MYTTYICILTEDIFKPQKGEDVEITEGILLDESPPDLHNINIQNTGSLVFDPSEDLVLRAANIFVSGSFEIGSEDCTYTGKLKITLTGMPLLCQI